MPPLITREIEYAFHGVRMRGHLAAPDMGHPLPGVMLVHDAFGLTEDLMEQAERLAELGFAVFCADIWGDGRTLGHQSEIGSMIGSMASDHDEWMGRARAALAAMSDLDEVGAREIVALGYCFGGSTALELLRTGAPLVGVVGIHPGLDLVRSGWENADSSAQVLLCTGAADPMATADQRAALEHALTETGIAWELDLYSHAKHAFTSPHASGDIAEYHPRAAARARSATTRFLGDVLRPDRAVIG